MNTVALIWITAAIVCIAAMIQNIIGFGLGVLSIAVLSMFLPYTRTLALVQAISMISTVYVSILYRRHINLRALVPIAVPMIFVEAIFTFYSTTIHSDLIYILLGGMFLFLAVFFFCFSDRIHIDPSPKNGICMGILTGISTGLFGIGGPPAALYLLPSIQKKEAYIASMNLLTVGMNLVGILVRLFAGSYSFSDLPIIGIGWIAVLTGTMLGLRILKRINTEKLRRLVYAFVGLNGIYVILTHLTGCL